MTQIMYTSLSEINELQKRIMQFVDFWVHKEKTTVPLKEIIINMKKQGVKESTAINSINGLIKKGYIGRSYTRTNKTRFIQFRTV